MKIEKTTVQMRERTHWEAIDLSLVFIKHFARFIYPGWLLFTFPLVLLLNFLLPGRAVISILILWYLKPLFERFPLFIASRLFFRQSPRLKNFFRRPLHFILKHLIGDLTYRRFSPWRSYSMPVRFLEELHGPTLNQRLKIVTRTGKGNACILTAVCLVFELGLFFGWIFLFIVLFMDSKTFNQLLDFINVTPLWVSSMQIFFYYFSLSIIEPFYILAGFFLYINRRVYLEGWDVELVFKRLANRLAGHKLPKQPATPVKPTGSTTVFLLLICLLFTTLPGMYTAAQDLAKPQESELQLKEKAESVKQDVRKIMDNEDFREWESREWWDWKHNDRTPARNEGKPNPLLAKLRELIIVVFGFFVRILPWLLGCGLVIVVVLFINKNKKDWGSGSRIKNVKTFYTVRPDGRKTEHFILPTHILRAAEEAWKQGEYRTAMSIIYRGALVFIIFVRKIFLPESATEGECLAIVRQALTAKQPDTGTSPVDDSSLLANFAYLIANWQRIAYAHHQPDDGSFFGVCDRWRPYLSVVDKLQSPGDTGGQETGKQAAPGESAAQQGAYE